MRSSRINSQRDDEHHYKQIKKRFEDLNAQRLKRSYADMRQSQRQFIEILPVIFHVNHPILPGYVSKDTPAGIPNYSVSSASVNTIKRFFKSFAFK